MWNIQSESARDSLGLPITVYTITLDGIPMAETTDASRAEIIRDALQSLWVPNRWYLEASDVTSEAVGEAFPE